MMKDGKFLEINGTKIHYEEYGNGPLSIVFVHAGIADSRMWDAQIEDLSRDQRVLTYDMRGYGLSPLVVGEFSHHADLITLMEKLKVERCVLVGCSKGGGIVLDTALADPDRVAGVVVVAGIAHGLQLDVEIEEPPQWEELVQAFKDRDLERTNELEIQIFVDGFKQPAGRADETIREKVRLMNAIALQNEANAPETTQTVLEPKAATRLADLHVPVLFITGALDEPVTLLAAELMMAEISHAEHRDIANVAHLPNMEAPEEFNRTLLKFIEQL
ncbi:MAG: alpha/beta hydrolase [Anaerolineales bacterium]